MQHTRFAVYPREEPHTVVPGDEISQAWQNYQKAPAGCIEELCERMAVITRLFEHLFRALENV